MNSLINNQVGKIVWIGSLSTRMRLILTHLSTEIMDRKLAAFLLKIRYQDTLTCQIGRVGYKISKSGSIVSYRIIPGSPSDSRIHSY